MSRKIDGVSYINTRQLEDDLGLSRQTLWRWRKAGKIPDGQRLQNNVIVYSPEEVETIKMYANHLEPASNKINAVERKNSGVESKSTSLTALSMFCGCGGMDLGFHEAGFDILWANDFSEDCGRTYKENFERLAGKDVFHEGDIAEITPPTKSSMKGLTVLLGGFPCQAYSNAGQRKGVDDKRGRLYRYCLDYIDKFEPQYTVFENVRGLLTIPGKNKRLIEEICDDLSERGYEVHIKLLNASKYSVPQNRLRVFIVGVRRKKSMPIFRFPGQIGNKDLTLGSVLPVPCDTPNQNDVITLNPQAYKIGKLVPEGGSWKSIPYEKLPARLQRIHDNIERYRWPNFYRRFSRDEIAGTITAAFKPENAGVWHPTEDRTFSAREIARIQSFPDDFVFNAKSTKAIYQMIGNAVPPKLAYSVANAIIDSINGNTSATPIRTFSEVRDSGKPIRPEDVEVVYDYISENAY